MDRRKLIAEYLLGMDLSGVEVAPRASGGGTRAQRGGKTAYVGDSLGVGTVPFLKGVKADVKVGRSSRQGVKALKRMGGYDRVVFDLGTNDPDAKSFARSIRRADRLTGNVPIVIPKVHGPNAKAKNRALKRLAGGDVRVVNPGRRGLGGDGIHYSRAGYRARARRVAG